MDIEKIKSTLDQSKTKAARHLAELRNDIAKVDDELHWLDHAPLDEKDALANVDRYLQSHQESTVEHFFYPGGREDLSSFQAQVSLSKVMVQDRFVIGKGVADIARVLVPLMGETLRRRLHDLIKVEAARIESGPPMAERPQLKKGLLARKYALEVEEEALICAAEDFGIDGCYRRSDCNPEIVLMMEVAE